MAFVIQCFIIGVVNGSIYILAGLGWMIVHNVTTVLNFTQGEFVMLGGMITTTAVEMGIPFPVALLAGIIITMFIGCTIERLVIEPLREAPETTLMIVTIAASLSIRIGALLIWGWEPKSLPSFTGNQPIFLFGAPIVPQAFWIIGATLAMVIGIFFFFQNTLVGRALIATSIDKDAARLMGINPGLMSMIAFALAAGLGAAGGIIATPIIMTSFSIGIMVSVKGLVATVIGAFEPKGVLLAALMLGLLESFTAGFISSGFRDIVSLTVMVLVLLIVIPGLTSKQG
jgi:branched-chain amino acid transport system permease protein